MKIEKINLKEQTYKLIKDRILTKKYQLGEQLVISQISAELNISNTPIREALSFLESEGLVLFEDGKYKVIELRGNDIFDLNRAMLAQILAAFEIVINTGKINRLIELEKNSLDEQELLKRNDSVIDLNYVKTFVNFDRNFVLASENKYLLKIFDKLFSVLILATSYNKKIYRDIHYTQHKQIYEALINEDYEFVIDILNILFDKDENSLDFEY